jgi:hypothetical protein
MTMDQYVDRFREQLQAEHASPRTVENYCDCVQAFVAFLRASCCLPALVAKLRQVSLRPLRQLRCDELPGREACS